MTSCNFGQLSKLLALEKMPFSLMLGIIFVIWLIRKIRPAIIINGIIILNMGKRYLG